MHGGVPPKVSDRRAIRRFLSKGVVLTDEPVPDYYDDFEDAKLLGIPIWELENVPMHWRLKARTVNVAKKEARIQIFNDAKGQKMIVYQPDV